MGIISPLGFRRPMPIAITLASGGDGCAKTLAWKLPKTLRPGIPNKHLHTESLLGGGFNPSEKY